MEQLELDFNRRDARGYVRIGPAAIERVPALRDGRLSPGACVLVVDDDGNQCEGVLREDPVQPQGHRLVVDLDWRTWTDGETSAPPARHLTAAG